LMEACQDDKYRVVEGVMTVMMNYNGNPNQGYPVDVLVVDKVKPIIYLPETNLVLLAKRDLCERFDIAEDDIVYFYYTDMEYTQYGFVSSCFIGLVYNAKTYLYKGTRSGHDGLNYSYNAEYIGMRDVEFDDEGNLILVDIKGKE